MVRIIWFNFLIMSSFLLFNIFVPRKMYSDIFLCSSWFNLNCYRSVALLFLVTKSCEQMNVFEYWLKAFSIYYTLDCHFFWSMAHAGRHVRKYGYIRIILKASNSFGVNDVCYPKEVKRFLPSKTTWNIFLQAQFFNKQDRNLFKEKDLKASHFIIFSSYIKKKAVIISD